MYYTLYIIFHFSAKEMISGQDEFFISSRPILKTQAAFVETQAAYLKTQAAFVETQAAF